MKKRSLGILAALLLCLSLLPTAALAADPTYTSGGNISTTGLTTLPAENTWYTAGSGSVCLTRDDTTPTALKLTLTLDNATIDSSAADAFAIALSLPNSTELTIKLKGTNNLTGGLKIGGSSNISVEIVSGEANGSTPVLNVTRTADGNSALYSEGTLTISGSAVVNAEHTNNIGGNAIGAGSITISGATVNATSNHDYALSYTSGSGALSIENGATVTATVGSTGTALSSGRHALPVTVDNSTLTLSGGTSEIRGAFTVMNNGKVTVDPGTTVNFDSTSSYNGSLANSGTFVNNGTLSFTGANAPTNDTGVRALNLSGTGYVTSSGNNYSNSGTALSAPGTLDLTTAPASGTGYTWDDTNKILTLTDALVGKLTLPNEAVTIAVNGIVYVQKITGSASGHMTTIQKAEGAASGTLTATEGIDTAGDLTIDGVTVTANGISSAQYYGIYAGGSVTVQNGADVTAVSGANYTGKCCFGLRVGSGLTVSGAGTRLTATGGSVESSGETESYGIYLSSGAVTISDGAAVAATGGNATVNSSSASKTNAYSYGIYAPGGLTINGMLTASAGEAKTAANGGTADKAGGGSGAFSIGVYAGGPMTVTSGTVRATGSAAQSTGNAGGAYSYGVYVNGTDVTVSGGTLTANGGSATATKDNYSEAYSIGMFNSGNTTANGGSISVTGGQSTCSATVGGAYSYGVYTENLTVNGAAAGFAASTSGNGAAIYVKESGTLTLGEMMAVETPEGGTVGTAVVPVEGADETYRTIVTADAAARNVVLKVRTPEPIAPSGGFFIPTYPVTVPTTPNGTITVRPANAAAGVTVTITATPDSGYALGELTVLDQNGSPIPLTDRGNGQYTFTMPAGQVRVGAMFTPLRQFVDVPANAYYYDAVLWAVGQGITDGVDAAHFDPNGSCTREQLVTFLWRAAGCPVVNYAMDFTDVGGDAYYSEAVRWAASLGIVGGYGDSLFGTGDAIDREQFVTILYRFAVALGYDVSVGEDTNILSYSDVFEISEYALPAFQWAVGAGVVQGSGDSLMPGDSCTRAQIVTMLCRLLGE